MTDPEYPGTPGRDVVERAPPGPSGHPAWPYVTAFHARSRTACAALQVRVGHETVTVWFGLGRRCAPGAQ